MRDSRFRARGHPRFFREAADHWLGLGQQYILLERILGGDRLGRPVGYDWDFVDSPCQFVEALSVAAKMRSQLFESACPYLSDQTQSELSKLLLRHLANSWNAADRQRCKEVFDLGGLDHKQPVRLAPIGGDLRQELVGGNAGRSGQVEFFADLLPDGAGNLCGCDKPGLVFGDIEIGFIE